MYCTPIYGETYGYYVPTIQVSCDYGGSEPFLFLAWESTQEAFFKKALNAGSKPVCFYVGDPAKTGRITFRGCRGM